MTLAAGMVVLQPAPAVAATSIALDKSAPADVLVGAPITYTLTARNPAEPTPEQAEDDFQFNVSFRDVLPEGVEYVRTTAPTGLGDPRRIAERDAEGELTGRTILIWDNVADLPDGSDVSLRYIVQPDPDDYPVGDVVSNDATGYASANERTVAKFDARGEYVTTSGISQAGASATTSISALVLGKSEPSPEHELVRGLHDRTTVFSLKVTNNGEHATTGVEVVDHLPAGLEFLGCGGVDNSAPGTEEYPGSGRLSGTPAVPDCLTPVSVTTVDGDLPAGYPAGVYTRVEWDLGDLVAGQTVTIRYAAGIPLRRNEMPLAGFTATANLDNNTGSSTRETDGEQSLTNRARAAGDYQGPDVDGNTGTRVGASDTLTVTSEDLAVHKSVRDAEGFVQGGEATYDLVVRSSEYDDGSDIVLVDRLPDGLCPADAEADAYTEAALDAAGDGDCTPVGSGNPAIEEVDYVDGVFVVRFRAFDLSAEDGSRTISHAVRMRDTYNEDDEETSAGDTYTNRVRLTGTTTPIDGTSESGTREVEDESQATLGSDSPRLDKRILRNTGAPYECDDPEATWNADGSTGDWRDSQAATGDAPFTVGSRVCFQVRVTFPQTSSTRLPVVTDYLPDNLAYEEGSFEFVDGVNDTPANLDADAIEEAFATGTASFRPGTDHGSKRYVPKGRTFAFRLSAIVLENPASVVDVQGNLAKLRWTDRAGRVSSLRDLADFRVPPVPPVTIDKRVARASTPTELADQQTDLRHGNRVHYEIAVGHGGSPALGNDTDLDDVRVWDVLPQGFECADVVDGTLTGTCTDPGDQGHPTFYGADSLSAITWTIPALEHGTPEVLSYDVEIPDSTSVGTTYLNTAHVRSFTTPTNLGGAGRTHFPADNVDETVDEDQEDTAAASDLASVRIVPAQLSKSNTSPVEPFNGAHDAVPGELVTYTIRAVVPARTTIYDGVVSDSLPTGMTFRSAEAGFSATGASPAEDTLPDGSDLDEDTGTLRLPSTYTNATDTDQVFEVRVVAQAAPSLTATGTLTNTASLRSRTLPGGLTAVPEITATSNVAVVLPSPTLTKTLAAGQNDKPYAEETRDFVLTARNAASTPTLHDTRVVDCVPAGLTVTVLPSDATQSAGDGTDGCSAGTTRIVWPVGTLAAGASRTLTYTVRISPDAAAGQGYTNSARLTGSTLDDDVNDADDEGVLTRTATRTLTVPSASVTKSIADATLTIGERAAYAVTVTIPARVTLYDATVLDAQPTGFTAGTLTTTSVTCRNADETPCTVQAAPGTPGTNLTANGSTVGWRLGDLASSNQTRTVTIVYSAEVADTCRTVATASCNTIGKTRTNTARLRWNQVDSATDPTSANPALYSTTSNSATATYAIQEPATTITKSVAGSTPAPGDTFTYTVRVAHAGGTNVSTAYDVEVQDVVPAGVKVVESSLTASGGVLTGATASGGGTITWPSIDELAPGQNRTYTYSAQLGPSASLGTSARVNTASVTEFTSLADGGRTYTGGSATASVTPAFPHVSIAKQVVGSAVSYVGDPQNFRITVTSDGASPAYDVDVTDVLPENWTFGSATVKVGDAAAGPLAPSDDEGNPQTVRWEDLAPDGLAPGKTIVIDYTATPSEDALDDPGAGSANAHVNTASVTAEDATDATGNQAGSYHGDPATATARIHAADLEVSKTAQGTPVAGRAFSWTISVDNVGGDPATGPIVVTDTIPEGVTNFSVSGTGWSCTSTTTTWTCTHAGPLTAAATPLSLTATGDLPAGLEDGTELANTATVTARTYDPEPDNDESTETVDVTTRADLAIDKRLPAEGLTAGQNATYTLDVTNLGPSVSRGPITVEDAVPAGTTFVSASGTGWECDEDDGVVTCVRTADLGVSQVAGQIAVTVAVAPGRTAAVVNTATVSGTTPQPDTDTARDNDEDTVSKVPTRTANLLLEKEREDGEDFVAGAEGTYVFTVRNAGPSTATAVTITDVLPSYLTYAGSSGTGWSCAAPAQTVTCTLSGSLGVDAESTLELTVAVAAGHTGEIVNDAKVVATEDPTGVTDGDTSDSDLESDLRITKSHDDDAVAGESLTYDLVVENLGASDAAGPIVVSDTVPTGMTYASASGAGWACEVDDGIVTCTHAGGLEAGDDLELSLTFDVAEGAGPVDRVDNIATVSGPNTDPELDNNSATDPTRIVDQADVRITKTRAAATVHAGADATWTLSVVNDGPSTADAVTVTEELPAGLTLVSISGSGWTCSDTAPISCSRATLPTGAAPDITVVTRVGSGIAAGTDITNVATVDAAVDTDDDNNESSATITTTASADLALTKSHDGTAVAGEQITYSLAARNDGPSDARGPITITDSLPAGLTYVSANDAWACEPGEVTPEGQEVECTLVSGGPVVAGDDVPELLMRVDVAQDQAGAELVNSAVVESTTPDPDEEDNADSDEITPDGEVDLSVTKSHTGPVEVGEELSFTIVVHNEGPSEARDVELEDLLPEGLDLVSASGEGWDCDDAVCALDDPLPSGEDAEPITVVVEVTPEAYPGVTNRAVVSTSSDDVDEDNDDASDEVVVPAKVDLSVVKALQGPIKVGREATYSLAVHNDGPTADPGTVTVTDQLPDGLTYVSAEATGWTCEADDEQLVTCERPAGLSVGATDVITLAVQVGAEAYPTVTNTATVTSPAADTDPENNASTVTEDVAGTPGLSIDKTLLDRDRDGATWGITVSNSGPTETTVPIVVTDVLPRGLRFESASGDGWECDAEGRTVTCTYEDRLPVGQSASFELETSFTAHDGSVIVNEASVSDGGTGLGDVDATDDAEVTAPKDSGSGFLPDTGGAALWMLLLGLAAIAAGISLRRTQPTGRHR